MIRRFLAAALATAVFLCVPTVAAVAQPSAALAQKARDAGELTAMAEQRGHVRVIVEFALPGGPPRLTADPASVASVKAQVAAMQDAILVSYFGSATAPAPGAGFDRAVRRLEISPMLALNVSLAELSALAADPRVVRLHYDRPERAMLAGSLPLIGMGAGDPPNQLGATGAGQAIAILDTGVDRSHEFITPGRVIAEACFSTNNSPSSVTSLCPNGQVTQTGTHVAGIAAGNNTNPGAGKPGRGVALNAGIVALQVFSYSTSTTTCQLVNAQAPCILTIASDQVAALDWLTVAVSQNSLPGGVKLAAANMSLGGGNNTSACDSDSRAPSITNLRNAGVAVVVSAGNGSSTSGVGAPGCVPNAVTVGSTDKSNVISCFSDMSAQVDLLAPGGNLSLSSTSSPSCGVAAAPNDINSSVPGNLDGGTARGRGVCRPTFAVSQCDGERH
jgi:hypothetical protein